MTKAGEKLLAAAREAVAVAKCEHDYVEGAESNGRRALFCMRCKATVHLVGGRP